MAVLPAVSSAQPSLTGVVRDGSALPVPGAVVAAGSPALIERVRTAVTDALGLFRIEDLRPGTYTVAIDVQGFRPYRLTGIELTGSFTATVDAVLQVGPLDEAISVVAEVPLVDVRSVTREAAMSGATVRAIPAARTYNALLALVPGVVTSFNDTVTTAATTSFPIHGGRANEGRLLLDGLTIGSPPNGNSATSYALDTGSTEEVVFTTSGGLGEAETAGLVMNLVPMNGGNQRHGSFFASGTAEWLQADNLTQALKDQGLTGAMPLTKLYDISATFGGPIRSDRAWYFASAHRGATTREVDTVYYNLNANDASSWLYAPDSSRRSTRTASSRT